MNQNASISPLLIEFLNKAGFISPLPSDKDRVDTKANHTANLLSILMNGSGDELFTKNDLRLIGAHPFSESTRRRKIKNGEYPPPVMLSNQMGLWTLRSIRLFLTDPKTYKQRALQVTAGGAK
jgi:hypothetical protein